MGAKAMSSHGSGAAGSGGGGGAALSRQGSVCSLTFGEADGQLHGVNLDDLHLCAGRKTVDEVWRDIQGAAGGACPRAQMTLENFLSRAGTGAPADAVGAGTGAPADAVGAGAGARGWGAHRLYQPAPAPELGHHHHHPAVGRPVPRPLGVGAGPVLDALYYESGAAAAGKNGAGAERGVAERSNERRKKRMIKNRESAARSRARKQAYTNELENKILQLEEENERLREQAQEPVVQYVPQQEVKNQLQLRRTNSANF